MKSGLCISIATICNQHNISHHALFSISLPPHSNFPSIFPLCPLSPISWCDKSHQLPPSPQSSKCHPSHPSAASFCVWVLHIPPVSFAPIFPSFPFPFSFPQLLNPLLPVSPRIISAKGEKGSFCSIIRAKHWNMHDLFGTQTTRNPLSYVENGAHKVVFILVAAPLLALSQQMRS